MNEQDYMNGSKRAWLSMLGECIRNLGYDNDERNEHAWILEREDIVLKLRSICADYGDNDWPDNLHLADVLERNLGNYLYENYPKEG